MDGDFPVVLRVALYCFIVFVFCTGASIGSSWAVKAD